MLCSMSFKQDIIKLQFSFCGCQQFIFHFKFSVVATRCQDIMSLLNTSKGLTVFYGVQVNPILLETVLIFGVQPDLEILIILSKQSGAENIHVDQVTIQCKLC